MFVLQCISLHESACTNPLWRSWAVVCWLFESFLDVYVGLGYQWLQRKKEECEESVTSGLPLFLSNIHTNTHTHTHTIMHKSQSLKCLPTSHTHTHTHLLSLTCLWERHTYDPDHQWDYSQLWLTATSLQINQSYCNMSLSLSRQLWFP